MAGTFWLVDGTALAYRSHFAFLANPLVNAKGQQTSATFGYVRALLDILKKEKVDGMAVAFDVSRETFRKELYKDYKATREKAPEEMTAQFPWIKDVTEALGIPMLERAGFEADDLIASAVRKAVAAGFDVRIVTGDKDMLQLVSDRVHVYDIAKKTGPVVIDPAGVRERFGVGPEKVADVLGLMGDASDNVPGVPKIGEKTAIGLVQEFGTLEEALERAGAKKGKVYENLVAFADQARLSKLLVTLRGDIHVDLPPLGKRDTERLKELFLDLDFNVLLKEVVGGAGAR
ncbi:MAG: 5'-3' exonuclease H3TH domain-containing protein, partial [Planctomycetota bacterium]